MNIRIDNLTFGFSEDNVLKDIDLTFEKGKFYSIIGPNGSGKTTLLKLIATLLNTPSNTVFIQDTDITSFNNKQKASLISLVPQMFNIEYEFTVLDIVTMGRYPYIKRFSDISSKDRLIIDKALEKTNLLHYKDRLVSNLSGGELQRLIVARAIVQETDIMLLDEPISHLDIYHQLDILNLTKSLANESNKTIICVIHDLNLAMKYSDYVIMLNNGQIHAIGSPDKVLNVCNIKEVYNITSKIISVEDNRVITY